MTERQSTQARGKQDTEGAHFHSTYVHDQRMLRQEHMSPVLGLSSICVQFQKTMRWNCLPFAASHGVLVTEELIPTSPESIGSIIFRP